MTHKTNNFMHQVTGFDRNGTAVFCDMLHSECLNCVIRCALYDFHVLSQENLSLFIQNYSSEKMVSLM